VPQGQEKLAIENDKIFGEFFFLLPLEKWLQIDKKLIFIPTRNFIVSGYIADIMRHFFEIEEQQIKWNFYLSN
jgi:hypothetical protein